MDIQIAFFCRQIHPIYKYTRKLTYTDARVCRKNIIQLIFISPYPDSRPCEQRWIVQYVNMQKNGATWSEGSVQ